MQSGTTPRQREIWLALLPYTDLSAVKQRPALVISSDQHNASCEDIVVLAVTSNLATPARAIAVQNESLDDGSLLRPSLILVSKLYTMHKSMLKRCLACISMDMFQQVLRELDAILGRC